VEDRELLDRVEQALREFVGREQQALAQISTDLATFGQTLASFVLDGGKRLRPLFCCRGAQAAGADVDHGIITAAAALELLQAGALIHDDVIDASDTRRGGPAVHRLFAQLHDDNDWYGDPDGFGDAAAILLGDLALVWADAMFAACGATEAAMRDARPVWDRMRVEVMAGQYLDVAEQARRGGSRDRAMLVARFKSAHYTVAMPLQLGAALAGADAAVRAALFDYGVNVGEAFQMRDDLLGVFGDPAHTGKPAGDDLREGKRTVLVAYALEAADSDQRSLIQDLLARPGLDDGDVARLRSTIAATGAVESVERLIAERTARGVSALAEAVISADALVALQTLAAAAAQRVR
jgi:geranylgeranyl diphosphate synthase type I